MGIFSDMFDLNGDGKTDAFEAAVEFMVYEDVMGLNEEDSDSCDFEDDFDTDSDFDF